MRNILSGNTGLFALILNTTELLTSNPGSIEDINQPVFQNKARLKTQHCNTNTAYKYKVCIYCSAI